MIISPEKSRSVIRNWMLKRMRIGRSKMKKLFRLMIDPEQIVEIKPGLRLSLDLRIANQDSIFWFFEETEPALQWLIKKLLPEGGTFFDVGANVGLMGLLAAADKKARVFFIEPHPRLAESIRENIKLNTLTPLPQILEWAASDKEGESQLYIHNPKNDGAHTLKEFPDAIGKCKVRTRRLDNFLNEVKIKRIELMKIDTEGHDFQVLKGLGDYLDPSIISLLYVEMEHFSTLSRETWDLLWGKGYVPYLAVPAFIDTLYTFQKLEKMGKTITFFRPVNSLVGGNMLWCKPGSTYDVLLNQYFLKASNL